MIKGRLRGKESTLLQYFELTAYKESDQIGFSGLLVNLKQPKAFKTYSFLFFYFQNLMLPPKFERLSQKNCNSDIANFFVKKIAFIREIGIEIFLSNALFTKYGFFFKHVFFTFQVRTGIKFEK